MGAVERRLEVSTGEAAARLNVSRPHIAKLFDSGLLAGRMVGTKRRIYVDSLEAYENEQQRRGVALDTLTELTADIGLYDAPPRRSAMRVAERPVRPSSKP